MSSNQYQYICFCIHLEYIDIYGITIIGTKVMFFWSESGHRVALILIAMLLPLALVSPDSPAQRPAFLLAK